MKLRIIFLIIFSLLLTVVSHFVVYFTPINVSREIDVELTQKYKDILNKDRITEQESEYLDKESDRIIDEITRQREEPQVSWKKYRTKAALVSWVPWLVFFLFYKLRETKEVIYVLFIPVIAAVALVISWAEVLVFALAIVVAIVVRITMHRLFFNGQGGHNT